jgi:hypothetical protein
MKCRTYLDNAKACIQLIVLTVLFRIEHGSSGCNGKSHLTIPAPERSQETPCMYVHTKPRTYVSMRLCKAESAHSVAANLLFDEFFALAMRKCQGNLVIWQTSKPFDIHSSCSKISLLSPSDTQEDRLHSRHK